jgi:putative oxidoreductase
MFKTKLFYQSYISTDVALLFLRIGAGTLIFINHGIEKIFNFNDMLEIFPDPLNIGKFPSLIFALITDGICSVLIIFGLFTRISALFTAINLFVALVIVNKVNITEIHGELAALYLIITLILFFYGSGTISIDIALRSSKKLNNNLK